MAVLGHNGSGKSTLAKHFNAMLLPTGRHGVRRRAWTRADEDAPAGDPPQRRHGVPEPGQPDRRQRGGGGRAPSRPENLGVPPEEIRRRVDEALQRRRACTKFTAPRAAPALRRTEAARGHRRRASPWSRSASSSTSRPPCSTPSGRREVLSTVAPAQPRAGASPSCSSRTTWTRPLEADRVIVMNDGEHGRSTGAPREVFPAAWSSCSALGLHRAGHGGAAVRAAAGGAGPAAGRRLRGRMRRAPSARRLTARKGSEPWKPIIEDREPDPYLQRRARPLRRTRRRRRESGDRTAGSFSASSATPGQRQIHAYPAPQRPAAPDDGRGAARRARTSGPSRRRSARRALRGGAGVPVPGVPAL